MDDEVFASIIKYLDQGIMPKDKDSKESQVQWLQMVEKYQLDEGTLVLKDQKSRRIVPRSQYYPLMYIFHNDPIAGHLGYIKVLQKLLERYYWPGMAKDVNQYIAACYQCQMKKPMQKINELYPIPPSRLFDQWGVDVVGPLLITSKGNRYIIVAVEYLSKWQEAQAVVEANALSISNFLYQNIICRFGCFTHLHTDRGTEFINEVVKKLTEKFRVKHHRSTPYRSQANGLVERFNKFLCDSLAKLVNESAEWDIFVEPALWAHRTSINSFTQLSPFMIVYGIQPQFPADQFQPQNLWDRMMQIVEGLSRLHDRAKIAIKRAQQSMKNAYSVKSTKQRFKIGDQVTMWWTPARTQGKFVPWHKGPYEVVAILGNSTYKLADERETLKAPINGDLLKLYKGYKFLEPIVVID